MINITPVVIEVVPAIICLLKVITRVIITFIITLVTPTRTVQRITRNRWSISVFIHPPKSTITILRSLMSVLMTLLLVLTWTFISCDSAPTSVRWYESRDRPRKSLRVATPRSLRWSPSDFNCVSSTSPFLKTISDPASMKLQSKGRARSFKAVFKAETGWYSCLSFEYCFERPRPTLRLQFH